MSFGLNLNMINSFILFRRDGIVGKLNNLPFCLLKNMVFYYYLLYLLRIKKKFIWFIEGQQSKPITRLNFMLQNIIKMFWKIYIHNLFKHNSRHFFRFLSNDYLKKKKWCELCPNHDHIPFCPNQTRITTKMEIFQRRSKSASN